MVARAARRGAGRARRRCGRSSAARASAASRRAARISVSRVLLVAQMADRDELGVAGRARRAQRRRRLDDHHAPWRGSRVEPRQAPLPAARRRGWHTRANAGQPRQRRGRDRGRCRSARRRSARPAGAARQRAIDVGRAARVQGDQQVGGRRRRRAPRRRRPSRPARGSAASAPPCASCRCWPRRAPARRCRRAAGARRAIER